MTVSLCPNFSLFRERGHTQGASNQSAADGAGRKTACCPHHHPAVALLIFLLLLLPVAAPMVAPVSTVAAAIAATMAATITSIVTTAVPAAGGPMATCVTTTAASAGMIKAWGFPLRAARGLVYVIPALILVIPLGNPALGNGRLAWRGLIRRPRGPLRGRSRVALLCLGAVAAILSLGSVLLRRILLLGRIIWRGVSLRFVVRW